MMNSRTLVTTLAAVFASLQSLGATTIALDFSNLPSGQGWTYAGSAGVTESDVFSVSGAQLRQNTIGIGTRSAFYALQQPGLFNPQVPFGLSVVVQVADEEIFPPPDVSRGFLFGVSFNNVQAAFGIGPNRVSYSSPSGFINAPFDSQGIFHTYSLQWDPAAGLFTYLINGSPVASAAGTTVVGPILTPRLFLGDGVNFANAQTAVSSYEFTQIPEPATGFSFVLAIVVLFGTNSRAWRRRSTSASS